VKPERARHVEAWLDGTELDMFKRPSDPARTGDARAGQSDASESGLPRATDAGGRRTVTITGRGAERYNPRLEPGARTRPQRRRHEREGFRPDRTALWAVVLCVALLLLATTTSHAATSSQVARPALARSAVVRNAPARGPLSLAARLSGAPRRPARDQPAYKSRRTG
jgi:hypothetical protein